MSAMDNPTSAGEEVVKPNAFVLRITVEKEAQKWIAHCLELDLVTSADTRWKAVESLATVIHAQIAFGLEKDWHEHIWHPAPQRYFDHFEEIAASMRPSSPPSSAPQFDLGAAGSDLLGEDIGVAPPSARPAEPKCPICGHAFHVGTCQKPEGKVCHCFTSIQYEMDVEGPLKLPKAAKESSTLGEEMSTKVVCKCGEELTPCTDKSTISIPCKGWVHLGSNSHLCLTAKGGDIAEPASAPDAGQPKSQGLCDVTSTERFENLDCKCTTYAGNKGPCAKFEEGANGLCVYCDHEYTCHLSLAAKRVIAAPSAPASAARESHYERDGSGEEFYLSPDGYWLNYKHKTPQGADAAHRGLWYALEELREQTRQLREGWERAQITFLQESERKSKEIFEARERAQAAEAERNKLLESLKSVSEVMTNSLSLVEFYAKKEIEAPANSQEAVRETRELLRQYRRVQAELERLRKEAKS